MLHNIDSYIEILLNSKLVIPHLVCCKELYSLKDPYGIIKISLLKNK